MREQQYEDYKYEMMDAGSLYLGAKYNYAEILENEDIPFKFRAIVERYIIPDIDRSTTLESHFYYMNKNDFSYKTFQQLKIKLKINHLKLKRKKTVYITENINLEEFVNLSELEKKQTGIVIQEIIIGKFALMSFSL